MCSYLPLCISIWVVNWDMNTFFHRCSHFDLLRLLYAFVVVVVDDSTKVPRQQRECGVAVMAALRALTCDIAKTLDYEMLQMPKTRSVWFKG